MKSNNFDDYIKWSNWFKNSLDNIDTLSEESLVQLKSCLGYLELFIMGDDTDYKILCTEAVRALMSCGDYDFKILERILSGDIRPL